MWVERLCLQAALTRFTHGAPGCPLETFPESCSSGPLLRGLRTGGQRTPWILSTQPHYYSSTGSASSIYSPSLIPPAVTDRVHLPQGRPEFLSQAQHLLQWCTNDLWDPDLRAGHPSFKSSRHESSTRFVHMRLQRCVFVCTWLCLHVCLLLCFFLTTELTFHCASQPASQPACPRAGEGGMEEAVGMAARQNCLTG